MARLILAAALIASVPAMPARADPVRHWDAQIAAAAARCGVPMQWIARVMRAESGGRTTLGGRPVVSRAGAMGLMQLMPATWAEMQASLALGPDPHDPADNIVAGACYLRLMYDRFGYPGLFGAYNAGPGRYAAWRAGRRSLPRETRAYLAGLTSPAARFAPTIPPVFVTLGPGAIEPRAGGLFLIRR